MEAPFKRCILNNKSRCCLFGYSYYLLSTVKGQSTRQIAHSTVYLSFKMDLNSKANESFVLENNLHERSNGHIFLETLVLIVINLFALVGNVLICLAVYRKASLRTITNMFIVTLAISDVVMAVLPMPLSVGALISSKWSYGHTVCQLQGFTIHVLVFQTVQVITLTAINRNFSVVRPCLYKRIFTKRNTLIMIIAVYILSAAVMAALIFFASSYFDFHPGKAICVVTFLSVSHSRIFTVVFSLTFIVIPFIVISFSYARVIQTIRRHKREFKSARSMPDSSSRLLREEDKLSKIVLAIILGFAACWIPCMIIDIVDTMQAHWMPRRVYLLYTYFGFASCAINPFLYGCMNIQVRREIKEIVTFWKS